MIASQSSTPVLRLVEAEQPAPAEWAWFCGHCAAGPPGGNAPSPMSRVCSSCGLGLLLETPAAVAPSPRDAFLVVDDRMTIQAVSASAEELLGVDEMLAVDRPVTEFLVAAHAQDGESVGGFADAIGVALGGGGPLPAFVRPWNTFGVRLQAQVAACGPPRAAVVVLRGGGRRMRLVED